MNIKEYFNQILKGQNDSTLIFIAYLFGILLTAYLLHLIFRKIFIKRIFYQIIKKTKADWDDIIYEKKVLDPFSYIIPLLLFYSTAAIWKDLSSTVQNLSKALIAFVLILVINRLIEALFKIYHLTKFSKEFALHKSYITLVKIIFTVTGGLVGVAIFLGRSPWGILTSVGALTTIIVLIFKDTILSFTSSMIINSHNLIKEGDWIESEKFNVDGNIIDVGLHVIQVQNWDKTIVSVPTHKILDSSFKNWRGMYQINCRRIKRSLFIDIESVLPCTPQMLKTFSKIKILEEYIKNKTSEIEEYNQELSISKTDNLNLRRLTNIGTFRIYMEEYLKNHPEIETNLITMIRQLSSTPQGIPLEVYAFVKTTDWYKYERIQSDIFDHFISIIPAFGLKIFQTPSGSSIKSLLEGKKDSKNLLT